MEDQEDKRTREQRELLATFRELHANHVSRPIITALIVFALIVAGLALYGAWRGAFE